MDEDICPNCDEKFDHKMTFDTGQDFSVSASSASLDKVCVFNVGDENWVYLHITTTELEYQLAERLQAEQ